MEKYIKNQLRIAIIAYIGVLIVGFSVGWTSAILPKLENLEETPLTHIISKYQASWIGSISHIGSIMGPFVSGCLSDVRGRKPCLALGGILTITAFLALASARTVDMILVGRILLGVGTSIIYVVTLFYIGEIASSNLRGMLLTGIGLSLDVGTLLMYCIGPFTSYPSVSLMGLAFTMIYMLGLIFIPDSPTFYILKGNIDKVEKTLRELGRQDETDKLCSTQRADFIQKVRWRDLFTDKCNRKSLFITLSLQVCLQLSGIAVLVHFATIIYNTADSLINSKVATIMIGITQLISCSFPPFFIEGGGRKMLLLASTLICSMSLALLGGHYYLDSLDYKVVVKIHWLPLVILIIYFSACDMGFGIIPDMLCGEMFKQDARSIGATVTMSGSSAIGLVMSRMFPHIVEGLGKHGTFLMFSGACGLAFLFTAIFVPETRGKSLSEIQEILSK